MLFTLMIFSVSAAQQTVNLGSVYLGSAGGFTILAKSGISTTGTTSILGDIGVSPIDSTAITGFGLIVDSSNRFATSPLVAGKVYAADYALPTPTTMTTAISDMQTAYTDAAGRTNPTVTELGAGNIDGMTLAPGLYKWSTSVSIPKGVTLSGNANDVNDVWIFQIAQDLTVGNGAVITLTGGAQAENVFWQVAGKTTLGTTSDFKGIILDKTAIVLNTGATLNGRAFAQTAVTLNSNTVTLSTPPVTMCVKCTVPPECNFINSSCQTCGTLVCSTPPINTCIDCAAPPSECNYVNSSCHTCGTLVCKVNDGSSSPVNNTQCTDWSTCNSDGMRTRTCTALSSLPASGAARNPDVSIFAEPCTPAQENITHNVVNQNISIGLQTQNNSGNSGQNNTVIVQDNSGTAPIYGSTQSGYNASWWNNFTTWTSRLFGGQS